MGVLLLLPFLRLQVLVGLLGDAFSGDATTTARL